MEIDRIADDIKFVNQIGQTLSIDERLKLEIALKKLTQSYKFDQLLFWGRIEGISSNYYIALGLNFKGNFEFPHKQFFWRYSNYLNPYLSTNTYTFNELPALNPEYAEKVNTFRQLFQGQPEKILVQVEEAGQDPDQIPPADQGGQNQQKADDDSDVEIKVPPKNFTELDRLSYVIQAIEYDCAVTPVGSFRLTPTHELRYNDSFKGLSQQEAACQKQYQHFKAPSTQEKKEQIGTQYNTIHKKIYKARDDALFHFNFLDSIEIDQPKGQWSVQSDSSKNNVRYNLIIIPQVTIRNLIWPGFLGYHKVNSKIFGYAYFGEGIKNVDFGFLL